MEHDKSICVAVDELDTVPSFYRNRVISALYWKTTPNQTGLNLISNLPDILNDPVSWKNVGVKTAPAIRKFLNKHGWRPQSDNKSWIKGETQTNDSSKAEGELDALIVHKTILNSITHDIEKLLLRSQEERRKLDETIRKKKDEYSKAHGYKPKYTPDDSKPSDIEEPSGA